MSRSRIVVCFALGFVLLSPVPSRALFHLAHVAEVMSGAGGNANVQYVEIRMLSGMQNAVGNSRLTAFNCDGTSSSVLLVVPANLANEGAGVRWIMASPSGATFLAASGISADFVWDNAATGNIDPTCGMVCWGAPGLVPPAPTWDATDPNNYVDCVGYGSYTGPTKTSLHDSTPASGTPTDLPPGDGTFSLTRTAFTSNNIADFQLACPTPENNAGAVGGFGPCSPPTTTTTTLPSSPPGPSKCTSKKLGLAGKKASGRSKCFAKAVKKAEGVSTECLDKPSAKFANGWAKADSGDDCLTSGDVTAIETKVDDFVDDLVSELAPTAGPSKCTSKKLGLAGKKASSKAKCQGKAVKKGLAVDGECVQKAEDKFTNGWAKADLAGDCLTSADAATIEGKVDSFVDDLLDELTP